jgi:hypothetical protein
MLRGESAPEPSDSHARVAPARLEPPTIDVKANVVEEKESRRTTPLRHKSAPRFEGLKDFPGLDLRGPMTRAPPATTDVAPEGTRFIAGFRNAGGAGPTSYSSQASLGKSRFPWWSGFTVAPNRRTTSRPAPE